MESIRKFWHRFLLGVATLIISQIGNPTPETDIRNTEQEDNETDYHLFI
jgi:hypothetical protein